MKINHNISAVNTNIRLLRNEGALTTAMERLSSGYKINHAVDAPAGMAMSNKMQAQINGLQQASRNSNDAQSVLETGDGALNELTSILQRMRELAVQAANDTNSDTDRDNIQAEIDELTKEIDRISSSTEFNTKQLLDGSLDAHVYGDFASRKYASSAVSEGHYGLSIDDPATQTTMAGINASFEVTEDLTGNMKINGQTVYFEKGMTATEVYEAIRNGAERADIELDAQPGTTFTTKSYGSNSGIQIECSSPELQAALGLAGTKVEDNLGMVTLGKDATVSLDTTNSEFANHSNATIVQENNKITITDVNGFEISFKVDTGYQGDLDLEVTDVGPMDIQVGANARQQISVRIPPVSTEFMYLDNVNVKTHMTASKALADIDNAIEYVNTTRSIIGAFTNRLEYTANNTDVSEENMTAALSRIKDVDMAEAMTEFTQYNVLVQAATSALSQANELPQMALQLIQ